MSSWSGELAHFAGPCILLRYPSVSASPPGPLSEKGEGELADYLTVALRERAVGSPSPFSERWPGGEALTYGSQ